MRGTSGRPGYIISIGPPLIILNGTACQLIVILHASFHKHGSGNSPRPRYLVLIRLPLIIINKTAYQLKYSLVLPAIIVSCSFITIYPNVCSCTC